MFTRGTLHHTSYPLPVSRTNTPGTIRTETIDGIEQTWAISRPVSSPRVSGAPLYLAGQECSYPMQRGGALALIPSQPHVAADPSDPRTWQRPYLFT